MPLMAPAVSCSSLNSSVISPAPFNTDAGVATQSIDGSAIVSASGAATGGGSGTAAANGKGAGGAGLGTAASPTSKNGGTRALSPNAFLARFAALITALLF